MDLTPFLNNGAVDVTATVAFTFAIVQMLKGSIDAHINPSNPDHDTVVYSIVIGLSLVFVWFLTWSGPGFHQRSDYAVWIIDTLQSALAAIGAYHLRQGKASATPVATVDPAPVVPPVVPPAVPPVAMGGSGGPATFAGLPQTVAQPGGVGFNALQAPLTTRKPRPKRPKVVKFTQSDDGG